MTQPLQVLVLEDDLGVAQAIQYALTEHLPDVGVEIVGDASQWLNALRSSQCDFVVSDLMGGNGDEESATEHDGDRAVGEIFNRRFVPLVVHSAVADLQQRFELYQSHPMLRLVSKSDDDSIAAIVRHFADMSAVATELRNIREQFARSLQDTLTKTVSTLSKDLAVWQPVLGSLVRRRVAAVFDEPPHGERGISAFERYLIPPVATSLLTGDILRRRNATAGGAGFRLVLSQSCDLAWGEKRIPKISHVLVACTCSDADAVTRLGLQPTTSHEKLVKALERLVGGADAASGLLVLPSVPPDEHEHLIFDLKNLELIAIDQIESGTREVDAEVEWTRRASQDSPFREQITWSLLTQHGRPAMPEMTIDWLTERLAKRIQGKA